MDIVERDCPEVNEPALHPLEDLNVIGFQEEIEGKTVITELFFLCDDCLDEAMASAREFEMSW